MGTTQDKQLEIQKIQSKIDALKKGRAAKITEADLAFAQASRAARDQQNARHKEIMAEYDPKIDELEDQREAAGGVKWPKLKG